MKNINHIFTIIRTQSPVLFWSSMLIFIFAAASVIGLFVDDRTLLGVNVWVKPLKFFISTPIYMMTASYLMSFYTYSNRKRKIFTGIITWSLLIEMFIVGIQGFRGVQSHYNMSSPLDGMMFAAMGILIGINVIIMALLLIDSARLKLNTEKSVQWAIFLGWSVVLVGSWVGGQMISQMGHNVGIADGGAGIPILNWSTIAGDLRIAHFFGLHGIQIIPLFAYWVCQKMKNSHRKQILVITGFALLYASWIAYTFYQAKQGLALITMN